MTEPDWLESNDPAPMLQFLNRNVRDRKVWLFAVACCRRVWHLLADQRSRDAVSTVEDIIDGKAPANALNQARRFSQRAWRWVGYMGFPYVEAALAVRMLTAFDDFNLPVDVARYARYAVDSPTEASYQSACLRDIFGNPFRPFALDLHWLTANVVDLARTIYEEKAFERMPILADALMDAGCDRADILDHCKSSLHVRGCWLVDLLLRQS